MSLSSSSDDSMDFITFPDLYKDWKDLIYTKELFEKIVMELKSHTNTKEKENG